MTMKLTAATADAALSAVGPLLNGGKLIIYNSSNASEPATAATALNSGATHTALATLSFPATAFPSAATTDEVDATARKIVAGTIATVTATATGTAHFFRCIKSDNTTTVYQGTCGPLSSGQQLELSDTAIISGGNVSISSLKIVMPTA